ncbi:MAG TPA: hypothetical protein VHK24_06380 [Steroidobacter sp.]|jgi:hypothetical protein|nr:hypothetical protein [Steroidobacter sp.]
MYDAPQRKMDGFSALRSPTRLNRSPVAALEADAAAGKWYVMHLSAANK